MNRMLVFPMLVLLAARGPLSQAEAVVSLFSSGVPISARRGLGAVPSSRVICSDLKTELIAEAEVAGKGEHSASLWPAVLAGDWVPINLEAVDGDWLLTGKVEVEVVRASPGSLEVWKVWMVGGGIGMRAGRRVFVEPGPPRFTNEWAEVPGGKGGRGGGSRDASPWLPPLAASLVALGQGTWVNDWRADSPYALASHGLESLEAFQTVADYFSPQSNPWRVYDSIRVYRYRDVGEDTYEPCGDLEVWALYEAGVPEERRAEYVAARDALVALLEGIFLEFPYRYEQHPDGSYTTVGSPQ